MADKLRSAIFRMLSKRHSFGAGGLIVDAKQRLGAPAPIR